MSAPATTIDQWRSVSAAASLMAEEGIKRLPVVHDGKLVGIITRADVIRAFTRSDADIERDIREEVILRSYLIPPADVDVAVGTARSSCLDPSKARPPPRAARRASRPYRASSRSSRT
jgi:CBS domain-containing protein